MVFTRKDYYKPFVDNFGPAVDLSKIKLVHCHATKSVQEPLSAPVTEIVWWYFAPDAVPKDYADVWNNFTATVVESAGDDGPRSEASGWVEEEVEFKGQNGEMTKGKAFLCFIGWDSIDHHMEFRKRADFQEHIKPVRAPVAGAEMVRSYIVTTEEGRHADYFTVSRCRG